MSAVPTPGRRADGDAGRMNPILMGSALPIVKAMGGRVKRLYEVEMKTRRRIV